MSEIKPPVPVTLIGTSDNGLVPTTDRMVAHTVPSDQPNLYVKVITPILAIGIRALNLFLLTFSAVLSAEGLAATGFDPTNVIKIADFKQAVMVAAWLGFLSAFVGTVKNLITVFGQLEGKYPLASGSI